MKKLAAIILILLLLAGLAACQSSSTPTPTALPSATPTVTNTPLPPTATLTPTAAPPPPLNSPNGPPLSLIKMFTAKDGWGLISNALLVTHDGGVNWFSVPLPAGQVDENSPVFFSDMNNLYLIVPGADGHTGLLYHTSNGGGTWESFPVPFLYGQLIMKYNIGYFMQITGRAKDRNTVAFYLTIDFGVTWQKIFPTESANLPEAGLKTGMSYITVEKGWLGFTGQDQNIQIYQTGDSGHTWNTQQIPEPQNIANMVADVQPPQFFTDNQTDGILPVDFIAKDSGEKNRVFYTTNDGGASWFPGSSVSEGAAYTFFNPQTGWAWGKGGVYFTSDGGQSWQLRPAAFGRSEHATCLSFVDANTGWMLTLDTKNRVRIYNTLDGGNTWVAVTP